MHSSNKKRGVSISAAHLMTLPATEGSHSENEIACNILKTSATSLPLLAATVVTVRQVVSSEVQQDYMMRRVKSLFVLQLVCSWCWFSPCHTLNEQLPSHLQYRYARAEDGEATTHLTALLN